MKSILRAKGLAAFVLLGLLPLMLLAGTASAQFVPKDAPLPTPYFGPAPGIYGPSVDVYIYCDAPGASPRIYYTTDGSDPTDADTEYELNSPVPVHITVTTTLKAIAMHPGWLDSEIATGVYIIQPQVATPTFSPLPGTYGSAQNVTISCATPSVDIYYTTDGSDPDTAVGTLYTAAVNIPSTSELRARAYKPLYIPSAIASGLYIITGTVEQPVFTPPAGLYYAPLNVTITSGTAGATIRYTTDGSTPTETSLLYTGPVPINQITTLRAIAFYDDWPPSTIRTGLYTLKVATPQFSPIPDIYYDPLDVTISCATIGAMIYYTTNESDPDTGDDLYTGAVPITETRQLKARAYLAGWEPSDIQQGWYTIAPAASVRGGGGGGGPVGPLAAGLAGLLAWMKRRRQRHSA